MIARALVLFTVVLAACSATAQTGSIGAVLGRDNDTRALYVRDVPEGLGASLAGLVPGDEILMISGQYTRDLDQKAIVELLRGQVGSEVSLTVARGSEVRHVRVKRTALREHEVKPKEERIEP
ncbi:MAG: PDZ domain-containing protein [Polyangiaceae bacterium]|nr:PDZ domain-containing protein [Polyangiaceae bacterium]